MPSFAIRLRTVHSSHLSRAMRAAEITALGPARDGLVETGPGHRALSDEFVVLVSANDTEEAIERLKWTGAAFEVLGSPQRVDN